MLNTAKEPMLTQQNNGITVLVLGAQLSSLDNDLLVELETRLLECIDRYAVGLLIDLGETVFIGGGFLNVLIRCHMRAKQLSRRFSICTVNSLPDEVMAITRLNSLWDVFYTHAEAIESMLGHPVAD